MDRLRVLGCLLACTKHKLTSINKQLVLLIYHAVCAGKAKKDMKQTNVGEMVDGETLSSPTANSAERAEGSEPKPN